MEKRKVLIDFELWRIQWDAKNKDSEISTAQLIDIYLKSINTEEKIQDEENKICNLTSSGRCSISGKSSFKWCDGRITVCEFYEPK